MHGIDSWCNGSNRLCTLLLGTLFLEAIILFVEGRSNNIAHLSRMPLLLKDYYIIGFIKVVTHAHASRFIQRIVNSLFLDSHVGGCSLGKACYEGGYEELVVTTRASRKFVRSWLEPHVWILSLEGRTCGELICHFLEVISRSITQQLKGGVLPSWLFLDLVLD
jgi:hypothetical protein